MSIATEAAAIVRAGHEAYNLRDFARARELAASDVELFVVPLGQTLHGPDAMVGFLQGWASAFPDSRVEDTRIVSEADAAAVEFIARGTQTGTFVTPLGEIPPTGRAVEVHFCEFWQVRDGRIVSIHTYFDVATFLRQLGVAE